MKIYVSVGTHEQPFNRLVNAVRELLPDQKDEWLIQYGVSEWQPTDGPNFSAKSYLSAVEVESALKWADILISQASPGNVFGALEAEVWPLVIGRRKQFGEHVDDHQVRFGRALAELRMATAFEDVEELSNLLEAERTRSSSARKSSIRLVNQESSSRKRAFRLQTWQRIFGSA